MKFEIGESRTLGLPVFCAKVIPSANAYIIGRQLGGRKFRTLKFSLSFRFRLESLLGHQFHRFVIGHVQGMHADVEDSIGEHTQTNLLHDEAIARIAVEIAFVHHHAGDVLRPAFHVTTVRIKRAQETTNRRFHAIGVFELDVVAG